MWCVQMCQWDDTKRAWAAMPVPPIAWNCDEIEAKNKARRLNDAFRPIFDIWQDVGEVQREYRATPQTDLKTAVV